MTSPVGSDAGTGQAFGPSGKNRTGADLQPLERLVTGTAGAGLLLYSLRGGVGRQVALGLPGLALAYMAVRGRNPLATALKIDEQNGAVQVRQAVTVDRPADELYALWRDLERLPEWMSHLKQVEVLHGGTSRWTAEGPVGPVQWNATLTADEPGRRIAWASVPGSGLENSGEVLFRAAPGNRGTEVVVRLEYRPPAGTTGAIFARIRGQEPAQQLRADLTRFKRFQELGFVPTTEGQTSGRADAAGQTASRSGQ